ncbi:transcriptional regulator [Alkaliphilus pronyensis]|uniref:Transcriptional regulator n=1 Tax=Alkaliphilus pronyensis TaxID=1482732 RepID=A0A6I0FE73_9FIRM|nr:transcriptional regulator [Alkaliphilus pronyensis]KAB3533497.1 transcriptional regulator [Alkaliphilus pronyensis]
MGDKFAVDIDKVIHERARLLILSYLASNSGKKIQFNELKESLSFTSGNLSVQLKNLEEVKYIKIHKRIKDNKPQTSVSLTPEGLKALKEYLKVMEDLIKTVNNQEDN